MVNPNRIYLMDKKNCEKSSIVFSHYIARVHIHPKNCGKEDRNKIFQFKRDQKHIKTKKLKKNSVMLNLNWTSQHKQWYIFFLTRNTFLSSVHRRSLVTMTNHNTQILVSKPTSDTDDRARHYNGHQLYITYV